MKYIKLKKTNNYYFPEYAVGTAESILAFFLIDDVGSGYRSWVDWFNNPDFLYTSSNATFVDKISDKIHLHDVLCDDEDGGPYFEIKQERFIKLLEDWDSILRKKPNIILITMYDDGNVLVEGTND